MIYRYWRGPVVGENVAHVWYSYASVVFLEFGQLSVGKRLPNGRTGNPRGDYGLGTQFSWPLWTLSVAGRVRATSDHAPSIRDAALRLLVGRKLQSLEISIDGQATRLRFSTGVTLTTTTQMRVLRSEPHWYLSQPDLANVNRGSHVVLRSHTANPRYWVC
jgi:hypothetical protein